MMWIRGSMRRISATEVAQLAGIQLEQSPTARERLRRFWYRFRRRSIILQIILVLAFLLILELTAFGTWLVVSALIAP